MAIDYSSFLICYHNDGFEVYSNGVVILIHKNGQTIKENVHKGNVRKTLASARGGITKFLEILLIRV